MDMHLPQPRRIAAIICLIIAVTHSALTISLLFLVITHKTDYGLILPILLLCAITITLFETSYLLLRTTKTISQIIHEINQIIPWIPPK